MQLPSSRNKCKIRPRHGGPPLPGCLQKEYGILAFVGFRGSRQSVQVGQITAVHVTVSATRQTTGRHVGRRIGRTHGFQATCHGV